MDVRLWRLMGGCLVTEPDRGVTGVWKELPLSVKDARDAIWMLWECGPVCSVGDGGRRSDELRRPTDPAVPQKDVDHLCHCLRPMIVYWGACWGWKPCRLPKLSRFKSCWI